MCICQENIENSHELSKAQLDFNKTKKKISKRNYQDQHDLKLEVSSKKYFFFPFAISYLRKLSTKYIY